MTNLPNTLRLYAEDIHSVTGLNERSATMSSAADRLDRLESALQQARDALRLPCDYWNKTQYMIVQQAIAKIDEALSSRIDEDKYIGGSIR